MCSETIIISDEEKQKLELLQKTELDDVDKRFSVNSLRVLVQRYLLKDENGIVGETPKQLFERVAITATLGDILYDKAIFRPDSIINDYDKSLWFKQAAIYMMENTKFSDKYIGDYKLNKYHLASLARSYCDMLRNNMTDRSFESIVDMFNENKFMAYELRILEYYDLMSKQIFLPNTPTLMNAGTKMGQLSACFVLPLEDSIQDIMQTASDAASVYKSGGGVGFNCTNLRPEGSLIKSTGGTSSGPISFLGIIDKIADVVKQGGRRRAANMGIMHWDHPDIEKFITAKTKPGVLENFNISIAVDEKFWAAGERRDYLLDLVAKSAWESAEPGIVFIDKGNEHNVMREHMGDIICTNPCGEQYLYPYESCNLGSINVSKFIYTEEETGKKRFNFDKFDRVVETCTRFLDNIIDINNYPLQEIDKATKKTRRVGLGIMGLADLLYELNIPYTSDIGRSIIEDIFEHMAFYSMLESTNISRERGSFPLFDKSSYPKGKLPIKIPRSDSGELNWEILIEKTKKGIRNGWTTTVAPTGTIAMIADCSNGIEPTFALLFKKEVSLGDFYYISEPFRKKLEEHDMLRDDVLENISNHMGSIQNIPEFPQELRDVFITAMDINWKDHVMIQAICQRWISNSISKTINMPPESTPADIKEAYIMANNLGCKGITVYRDGSRLEQVMHRPRNDKKNECPHCGSKLVPEAGCMKCSICSFSGCSIS